MVTQINAQDVKNGELTDADMNSANVDGNAGTASMRTLGTGATQACGGTDARLSDARTPTAHSTTHISGGSDEVASASAGANLIPKAGSNGQLDPRWLPTSAPHDRRKFGATNYDPRYIAGCISGVGLTTVAVLANRIYARSFTAPYDSGVTVNKLGLEITAAAGTSCRLGIYSWLNGYPDSRIVDSGLISTASIQYIEATIAQALTPGIRYFAVAVFDNTPTVRAITVNQAECDLGFPAAAAAGMYTGFHAALTFGALPSTFPASPTMLTGVAFPALYRGYSA